MNIDIYEVYRYLSVSPGKVDERTKLLVEECICEITKTIRHKHFYESFDITTEQEGIALIGSKILLCGYDIKNHLEGCSKCVIMAATLGIEIDRMLDLYSRLDLTKGLILNACATAAIEAVCDEVQDEIRKQAETIGCNITERYSPGYGDLPLSLQSSIVNSLDLYKRIGLSANESNILIPRKSVTAFIGIGGNKRGIIANKCKSCTIQNTCEFRKRGINCEK